VSFPHSINIATTKRIEEVSAQYDSARSEESKQTLEDGWILYERSFWERRGEEFGWEALALALRYFRYKNSK